MARTFQVLNRVYVWTDMLPGLVRQGDVVRVLDDGVVVPALVDDLGSSDPEVYIVAHATSVSTVRDVSEGATDSVQRGVQVHYVGGGVAVIPLTSP